MVDQLCASVTFIRDRASFSNSCVLQHWERLDNWGNADQVFWEHGRDSVTLWKEGGTGSRKIPF